jgi:dihydrofolate reductase
MTKPRICAVVAMSENRVIGRDGGLPWHLPEDLKHFKTVTMGKPVIMGRKTFESIGKPLPGRANIVISRNFSASGITVVPDMPQAINAAGQSAEIMIVGGGQIYEQALPLTDRIYLTLVHQTIEGDTKFPELNKNEWQETARDDRGGFSFITLDRR